MTKSKQILLSCSCIALLIGISIAIYSYHDLTKFRESLTSQPNISDYERTPTVSTSSKNSEMFDYDHAPTNRNQPHTLANDTGVKDKGESEFDIMSVSDEVLLSAGIDPEYHRKVLRDGEEAMANAKALLAEFNSLMDSLDVDPSAYSSSLTQDEYDKHMERLKSTPEWQEYQRLKEKAAAYADR